MTSEFVYKLGQLYRALYDAVYPSGDHLVSYQRALIHPLSEISFLVLRAHQVRAMTPTLDLCVSEVLKDVSFDEMQDPTPLPTALRGSFSLGYTNGPAGLADNAPGVKAARIRAGLSVRALADAIGCSPTTVQNIELGYKVPRADTLRKIADVLGCSLDQLWPCDSASLSQ